MIFFSYMQIFFNIMQNKKIPVFRVTRPYLNLLVKPRIFFKFSGKKNIFVMHFERQIRLSKCIKLYLSPPPPKKICVPTLPKIFRPTTLNTFFFYLALLTFFFKNIPSGKDQRVKQLGSRSEWKLFAKIISRWQHNQTNMHKDTL